MTAQIANGGHTIKPKIIVNNKPLSFLEAKKKMDMQDLINPNSLLVRDKKNLEIVQKAMFSSTNEIAGTSYGSRIDDPKYQFAGKTGTAQVLSLIHI